MCMLTMFGNQCHQMSGPQSLTVDTELQVKKPQLKGIKKIRLSVISNSQGVVLIFSPVFEGIFTSTNYSRQLTS